MNDPQGSIWRRWDLHFHTPKSHDYQNKGLSAAQVVEKLLAANIEVVAVTDHHTLDVHFIQEMQAAAANRLTILPGIELASNLGGDEGVHFIAIFREDIDLSHVSQELMSKLDLATKLKDGIAIEKLYVEFPIAAKIIQELGGIITIHGHGKAANFETITSRLKFKQQQKTDLLRDHIDIIEAGSLDHTASYREKIFPAIGFERPLIVCSDNHNADKYSVPVPCWIKADPTFDGLRMAIREPSGRFWLGETPPPVDKLEKNKTRYIKKISFVRKPSMPAGEEWMQGEIPLNPGLVAIIGNKGSGKSALADCLGLLGSCSNSEAFSFLDEKHFRDPRTGRAQYVEATLHWHDGEPKTRTLSEEVREDEPERIKYLPQYFVEKVCNELASPGGGEFERELKKVVFSKVAAADRLGQASLDDLIEFRTQELCKAADSLAEGLHDLGTTRSSLEDQLDPLVRSKIENRIIELSERIKSHLATKPVEVAKPVAGTAGAATDDLSQLATLQKQSEKIAADTKAAEGIIASQQLRAATAKKLEDKLDNLKAEFDRRMDELSVDAKVLGLDPASLASLTIDRDRVEVVRTEAISARDKATARLKGPPDDNLTTQKAATLLQMKTIRDRLDLPNWLYQAYLKKLEEWQDTARKLNGSADEPDSFLGLQAQLANLDQIPTKIAELTEDQEAISFEVHKSRISESEVFTELYGAVQKFISDHPLAKDHLKLDFNVQLVQEGFVDGLLAHLTQNRTGSFYGVEDGRAMAEKLVAAVDWSKWENVKAFLEDVVQHLHEDKRPGCSATILLKNQIGKGKTAAELYEWLYGLTYVKPRYMLRWDGKDVAQLSPGERGTLLLVFYLLIDTSDIPIIIDQPEANLDNITVANKLVHCIRDARTRRQVIIVTHNPNLAVVCDADQIIHASMDKTHGSKMTYKSGALENIAINRFTIDVLEGGRRPFNHRDDTYRVAEFKS
jgi:energy-coupling factor transporter ATP-binding protein EcfA2